MAHGNELLKQRFFYLKLPKNWFKNARIKKLRKIAGGDTYTVIYLKMLLMAMNHESTIIYEGIEKTIEEELALKLDEDVDNVRVTIQFLKANELWEEKKDGDVHLTECDSMTGSETYINILKKRQKAAIGYKNSNQIITEVKPNYNEIDIDIDKELEIDKEKDKEKDSGSMSSRLYVDTTKKESN